MYQNSTHDCKFQTESQIVREELELIVELALRCVTELNTYSFRVQMRTVLKCELERLLVHSRVDSSLSCRRQRQPNTQLPTPTQHGSS